MYPSMGGEIFCFECHLSLHTLLSSCINTQTLPKYQQLKCKVMVMTQLSLIFKGSEFLPECRLPNRQLQATLDLGRGVYLSLLTEVKKCFCGLRGKST